jgi:hypothetical protein
VAGVRCRVAVVRSEIVCTLVFPTENQKRITTDTQHLTPFLIPSVGWTI